MRAVKLVDVVTGEVLSTAYPQAEMKQPAYFKWFVTRQFFDSIPFECLKLFSRLADDADYQGVTYVSNKTYFEMEVMGHTRQVVRNKVQKLKKAKWLLPTDRRGVYRINPYLFAKGSWKDIRSVQKLSDEVAWKHEGMDVGGEELNASVD